MVERLPAELRSDTALHAFFEQIFPGQVHSAVVCMDLRALEQLSAARDAVIDRLEVRWIHLSQICKVVVTWRMKIGSLNH